MSSTELTELEGFATEAEAIATIAREAEPVHVEYVWDDGEEGKVLRSLYFNQRGELVHSENEEVLRGHPQARRGAVLVHTQGGLVQYCLRHLDEFASTLWGDIDTRTVTVILNDHAAGGDEHRPGWGDHRAVLKLAHPPEWQAWASHNDQWLSQVELAEFLEEHNHEIAEPDGATMLEVARTLQATKGATFKQSTVLHSGEQELVYEEQIAAKAGVTGKAEIPRRFTVALRPFRGSPPVKIEGSFRFRIREGHLSLGYVLLHLDKVVEDAVNEVTTFVGDALDLDVIAGSAPTPRR
ncbi:MAG: YfdQ family protein [Actinobacteria bacterium]|nr:YfdQ family protein [Actinomycetota bacterium]